MKTKIALIATGTLLSAGVTMHLNHYCPLQHLHHSISNTTTAPASSAEVKPNTFTLR